jgi:hypothetical protein
MPHINSTDFAEDFTARVNYAAKCFMRGTNSRTLDACFEMYDGEFVATALTRRAWRNPKLHAVIAAKWSGQFPSQWTDIAERLAHIPTRQLAEAARLERAKQMAANAARDN